MFTFLLNPNHVQIRICILSVPSTPFTQYKYMWDHLCLFLQYPQRDYTIYIYIFIIKTVSSLFAMMSLWSRWGLTGGNRAF